MDILGFALGNTVILISIDGATVDNNAVDGMPVSGIPVETTKGLTEGTADGFGERLTKGSVEEEKVRATVGATV